MANDSIVVDEPHPLSDEELNVKPDEPVVDKETEIPEKFKEKSKEDVIAAYQALESRLGKQGSELGELRKLTDQMLQQQLTSAPQPKEKEATISEEDFYDNPKESVEKVLDNHPAMQRLQELEMQVARDTFATKHPKWMENASNTDFQGWVQESPFRRRLWQEADSYNFEAADELFSAWEERQSVAEKAIEAEKDLDQKDRAKKLKEATTETGATGKSSGGKKFRRADLIRMRIEDPQQYDAREEEFRQAYADGRVV